MSALEWAAASLSRAAAYLAICAAYPKVFVSALISSDSPLEVFAASLFYFAAKFLVVVAYLARGEPESAGALPPLSRAAAEFPIFASEESTAHPAGGTWRSPLSSLAAEKRQGDAKSTRLAAGGDCNTSGVQPVWALRGEDLRRGVRHDSGPGSAIECTASSGGTGAPYYPQTKQELIDDLTLIYAAANNP